MAKNKKDDARRSYLQTALTTAQKEFNSRTVYVAPEHEKKIYGVPFPCLALKYLFHSNVLPMSRIIGLAGSFGSCKSSFGFEMLRWLLEWGGIGRLVETEAKLSEQAATVIGEDSEYLLVENSSSVQESQKHITGAVELQKKTGFKIPEMVLCDSLTGSEGEETAKKMFKDGYASKNFPEMALLWSQWFRVLDTEILDTPFIFAFTNHLKKKIDAQGPAAQYAKSKAGGDAQDFHATYYFYMSGVKKLSSVSRNGLRVKFKSHKNSMGPGGQEIQADFLWEYPDADRPDQQYSFWDWYGATAYFLTDPKTPTAVRNVLDVKVSANKYSCKELNLSGVSATELGAAVEGNPDLVQALEAAMHIPRRRIWYDGKVHAVGTKGAQHSVSSRVPSDFQSTELATEAVDEKEAVDLASLPTFGERRND